MKCYQLRDWGLAQTKAGFCVEGLCEGNSTSVLWHSSEIVKRISPRLLESSTGSQYKLVGPMSKANCSAKYLSISTLNKFKNGFPVNWKKLLQRKIDSKGENAKKRFNSTNGNKKGMEGLMVGNTHQNIIPESIPFKMVPNMTEMPQVLSKDVNDCYEIDCLTAFDSDNLAEESNKFASTNQTVNSQDDSDIDDLQNVRKRLNFDDIDDTHQTQASDLFAKTANKRSPESSSLHKISNHVLMQSFPDHRTTTTTCRPRNKALENLNVSEDCLLTDIIHFEPMANSKPTFSVQQLLERKQPGTLGNSEAMEIPSIAALVNSKPQTNKRDKIKKSSKPQTIPKPHKIDAQLKFKRPLPNTKKESSPKRLRLESCGDAFATNDEDLNHGHVGSQDKVTNLSNEAPMSCNPNDISFDALMQSFGPTNEVFTCRGSPNKIVENVFLNISQDCLLSDSIYGEHDDKSRSKNLSEMAVQTGSSIGASLKPQKNDQQKSKNLSEMAVQTGSSISASLKPQKNDQQAKQSNKKVGTKRSVSRSPKRKSAPQKVNLKKQNKIKKKPSKVDKENNLPEFEVLKGKTTLKKNRAFKKLMTDCLKTQGNRNSYFANISQQQVADKEAAKVLALFDGDNETSDIQFDLTSSMFSKSPVAGVSKTLLDSTSSVMNDTAALMSMPSLQVVRDADLEIFRINKIMKSKKITEPKAHQAHNVKVQKGSTAKKRLELPEEAFQMNELREDESGRDDYFNESEL